MATTVVSASTTPNQSIDWVQLETIAGEVGSLFWSVIQPYLPALARASAETFNGFCTHLFNRDWNKMNELLYEQMTVEERRALDQQAINGCRQAATDRLDKEATYKSIALQVLLKAVTLVI